MALDYERLGLNNRLVKKGSLMDQDSGVEDLAEFRSKIPRGGLRAVDIDTNNLISFSNVGFITGLTLGSMGSSTELIMVKSTLTSDIRPTLDILFAFPEASFYRGTVITGTADPRSSDYSGTRSEFIIENGYSYQDANGKNVVSTHTIRNMGTQNVTISFRSQWRMLKPPSSPTPLS